MNDVYGRGGFKADPWIVLSAEASLPSLGQVILPKARLLAELAGRPAGLALGVLLEAGDSLDDLAGSLDQLDLIAVNFPKFADGRGFSIARLLRERYGYKGALRAVGDVLLDLIPHMERVGFSEFTVTNEPTRNALKRGDLPDMPLFYQPAWTGDIDEEPAAILGRPWLRRAV